MRVLITRPENRAGNTAEKLRELGHETTNFPLFAAVGNLAALRAALDTPHSAIAVTSAEAARGLADLGEWLQPHLQTPVFAVGKATARAARAAGFADVMASSGGGADLAGLVIDRYDGTPPALPILYLAGEKRMGRFEKLLADSGFGCVVAETYRMEPIAYSIEEQQALLVERKADAVMFYSRETAKAFFDLAIFAQSREAIAKTLFLCLSRNIAEAVPEELKTSAVVSASPDEDELIDLL